jgi:hypothetical protein
MDVAEDKPVPCPFLMTRDVMARDMETWGKDDWHYTMFNEGRMPRGMGSRRVITRQLCLKHHAMEEPVWRNSNLTYITCLDAAYRAVGGDRCVMMRLAFGQEAAAQDGGQQILEPFVNQEKDDSRFRTILALLDTFIIPIAGNDFASPEDQIVMYVKQKHDAWGIGPEAFYYDAGMRTSLVTAFARLWSPKVNSIDFGGKPTERPVSRNIAVSCREYYSKFVTELWWSWRIAVEAGQVRNLSEEIVAEGCAREWKTVGANKIEVETKEEMKVKMGRSPDLADCFCIGLEGARSRGFTIGKLGDPSLEESDHRWKRDMIRKAAEQRRKWELDYAA